MTVKKFNNPIVIISVLDEDLDRSFLTVRDGPKPYFKLNGDSLQVCGVPVSSDPEDFFRTHTPQISSYLLTAAFRLSTGVYTNQNLKESCGSVVGRLISEAEIVRQKNRINQAILAELIRDLKSWQLSHVFLLFESSVNFFNPRGWRMRSLNQVLQREENHMLQHGM